MIIKASFYTLRAESAATRKMADRFFRNAMPRFVPEKSENETTTSSSEPVETSLTNILSLPYRAFSDRLKTSALSLKETVVRETWISRGKRVQDYTVYTGSLGTAYLTFKAYQVTNNVNDLRLCLDIVEACDTFSRDSSHVTFLCGRAGVCALGAVAAKHFGDESLLGYYISQFKKIKMHGDLPNEVLYGKAGLLWASSFINHHIGNSTISSTHRRSVVDEIIKAGRKLAERGKCPLMYEWHGKKYWGAAHGLAGIMHVLLHAELKPDEIEDVSGTLRYMIKNRFPSGNYPSSEGSESDRLVHWCHGAPGVAVTLVKAAKVFEDKEFLQAAVDAADVVWERGLLKRVGICHGISGNAYVFLALYRLTGKVEYLYKAKAFTSFLYDRAQTLICEGEMHGGDHPYSLFEGIGGMAFLFLDMVEPSVSRFPGYEL